MQNKISSVVVLYNEEQRIEKFLKALSWCDDIIIINKSSTDNTSKFLKGKNITVINVPYVDNGSFGQLGVERARHEWIAFPAVSDFISYDLIKDVNEIIARDDFDYNTITVPFNNYILGMNLVDSPWYCEYKRYFFRKSSLSFTQLVHREIVYDQINNYELRSAGCVNHLTHQSVLRQLERHTRYTREEASELYEKKEPLKVLKKDLLKLLVRLIKKTFLFKDENVFALGIAFFMYYSQRYLFTWEKYQDIDKKYEAIKDDIIRGFPDVE